MRLIIAIRAFFKALKDKKGATLFLEGKKPSKKEKTEEESHLRLLMLFQQSGRLIDFLQEDISQFKDQQVGAAARQVHTECRKLLEDVVTVRPIVDEAEGKQIEVQEGYDSSQIKLCGNIGGKLPLKGTVRHRGWRAQKMVLPQKVGKNQTNVLAPAQVEVQ